MMIYQPRKVSCNVVAVILFNFDSGPTFVVFRLRPVLKNFIIKGVSRKELSIPLTRAVDSDPPGFTLKGQCHEKSCSAEALV